MPNYRGLKLRRIEFHDLSEVTWEPTIGPEEVLVASIACEGCQRFQEVESQPTGDRKIAVKLCIRVLNQAGWRALEDDSPICPKCSGTEAEIFPANS